MRETHTIRITNQHWWNWFVLFIANLHLLGTFWIFLFLVLCSDYFGKFEFVMSSSVWKHLHCCFISMRRLLWYPLSTCLRCRCRVFEVYFDHATISRRTAVSSVIGYIFRGPVRLSESVETYARDIGFEIAWDVFLSKSHISTNSKNIGGCSFRALGFVGLGFVDVTDPRERFQIVKSIYTPCWFLDLNRIAFGRIKTRRLVVSPTPKYNVHILNAF